MVEIGGGAHTELREHVPGPLIGAEGLRLAVGSVERHHQLTPEGLPQRMLHQEGLQLGYEPTVATHGEIGVDPELEGDQPQFLESCHFLARPLRVLELRVRRATPQPERLLQHRQRLAEIASLQLLGRGDEVGKPVRVDRLGTDPQPIPGGLGDDHVVVAVGVECIPQLRDVEPQRREVIAAVSPQRVDDAIRRHDERHVSRQQRQQLALFRRPDHHVGARARHDLQWTQNPYLHGTLCLVRVNDPAATSRCPFP